MRQSCSVGDIGHLLDNNRKWIQSMLSTDPEYFERYKDAQKPQYFWIGCSDSRVVAEAALGLGVGDMFVHRNVGNCISHCDQNAMSALEYSVKVLKVRHVLVCGHENCGAVQAALTMPSSNPMLTNCWISQIRDIRNANVGDLAGLELPAQVSRLVQLNVCQQVFNVCTSPVMQQAWETGQEVFVHGLVFNVATGELRKVVGPYSGNQDVPEDSAELDTDSLASGSPTKMHRRLSLAGVIDRLGEGLQGLDDGTVAPARERHTHGCSADCAVSGVPAAGQLSETQPPSSTSSPRDHEQQRQGSHVQPIQEARQHRTRNSLLFDSASDPHPSCNMDNQPLDGLSECQKLARKQPGTATFGGGLSNGAEIQDRCPEPQGEAVRCGAGSMAAGSEQAEGLQQFSISTSETGDVCNLTQRLSKQMSFHKAFEDIAKCL